jgi:hypothetical protein
MKPLRDAWLIQIEVTTACRRACAHCTRGVKHCEKPLHAGLDFVERALASLAGWKKGVGCTGGEPTLHPEFPRICGLYRRHFPKQQCGLWTCGGPRYKQYRDLIEETFGIINYNDHGLACFHHPVMVASEEVIPDAAEREKLIDRCWLQLHWSPIATVRGGFFCEVAATFDALFNGPGGYPLEPGWWQKDGTDMPGQRKEYCRYCSIALPIAPLPDNLAEDWVSRGNAERLLAARSPQALNGRLKVVDEAVLGETAGRDSRLYATRDSAHCWARTPVRAWFWKRAKYRHLPHGQLRFLRDTVKFLIAKALE